MARSWSLVSEVSWSDLSTPTWAVASATTPAVVRPSSWSELMAATCGRQCTDFIRAQGFDMVGAEAGQGAGGDGAQVGRFQLAGLRRGQRRDLVGVPAPRTGPCPRR